jgi:L-rhamnose mutarotase
MKRYGQVIKVRSDKLAEYRELHRAVWPTVLKKIKECGIRNYSIFFRDGFLFSYFEYIGEDFASDMASMAADPETRRWWALTDPCQETVDTAAEGEWWAEMEEVFHVD